MNESFTKVLTFKEVSYGDHFLLNNEIHFKVLDHEPKAFSRQSKKFVSVPDQTEVAVSTFGPWSRK